MRGPWPPRWWKGRAEGGQREGTALGPTPTPLSAAIPTWRHLGGQHHPIDLAPPWGIPVHDHLGRQAGGEAHTRKLKGSSRWEKQTAWGVGEGRDHMRMHAAAGKRGHRPPLPVPHPHPCRPPKTLATPGRHSHPHPPTHPRAHASPCGRAALTAQAPSPPRDPHPQHPSTHRGDPPTHPPTLSPNSTPLKPAAQLCMRPRPSSAPSRRPPAPLPMPRAGRARAAAT